MFVIQTLQKTLPVGIVFTKPRRLRIFAVVTDNRNWEPIELLLFVSGRSIQENSIIEIKTSLALIIIPKHLPGYFCLFADEKDGLYPTILCLLKTGVRIEEIQALQWADINFEKGFIEVKRSFR